MTDRPEAWTVHDGRDPDAELRSVKARFGVISRGYQRAMARRRRRAAALPRIRRWARIAGIAALVVAVLYVGLMSFGFGSPLTALRHLAASPSCAAARAMGLPAANRGEPGYWPSHDRDNDGRACEPWVDA